MDDFPQQSRDGPIDATDLSHRLQAMSPLLHSLMRHEAGPALLRFETVEDLVQGALQEALRSSGRFEWQGEDAMRGWLYTIARRHIASRRDYWFAMKRSPGALLRLTLTGWDGHRVERDELAANQLGPSSFAFRREQLVLINKALVMLLPRDREIVTLASNGASVTEIAARLEMTEDAAERARSRALDRLRKAFVLVSRRE